MYSKEHLSKSNFAILCQYLEGLQGKQRDELKKSAQEIIEKGRPQEEEKSSLVQYKRAIKIAEILS